MGEIKVWASPPTSQLRNAVARLSEGDARLRALNQRTIDIITQVAIERVKAKGAALPTRPPQDRGRRKQLVAGVGKRRTRYGYRVTTSMPSPQLAFYPRSIQTEWRHPTFGHRPIVTQVERWDWFIGPISALHDDMQRGLTDAIERATNDMST